MRIAKRARTRFPAGFLVPNGNAGLEAARKAHGEIFDPRRPQRVRSRRRPKVLIWLEVKFKSQIFHSVCWHFDISL